MKTVEDLAQDIVAREGGYVNDPDDPGGATKFGVTIHTARRLGMDLDENGQVDARDVKRITKEQAVDIFLKEYFYKPKIDTLPKSIQASVFDMFVNSGGNAIRILQRLLCSLGAKVKVDGSIGAQTRLACQWALRVAPDHFVDAYGIERRNFYYGLADQRRASRKYARARSGGKGGWIKRAEEFLAPRYHYSLTEHKNRVAKWD